MSDTLLVAGIDGGATLLAVEGAGVPPTGARLRRLKEQVRSLPPGSGGNSQTQVPAERET